ncbi:MAG TPA: hypothetical protein P5531_10670 [Bacteroidales bacterium]|nr:hypothetical protein [Bacteroidales bacterium]HSA43575.1 hypothetical protein [Bacteroidales bacterium]
MKTTVTIQRPGSSTVSIEADTNLALVQIMSEIMYVLDMESALMMMNDKPVRSMQTRRIFGEKLLLDEKPKMKICVMCNQEYKPTSNSQKICKECHDDVKKSVSKPRKDATIYEMM